ncbi:hypothetical protein C8F04DRAFT_1199769 [Mycena alexandri]|uniref:F-box domain-containing protein n=1 Tax=Mycena alexandri TaxID=1745969 RepID=A0AAD6RZT8_9AGAR|nr:hypothetical protein C8F04DRAFT_1199769 [Mycena alexandri]
MANLVTDLLVSNPQVWPLLQTVTLCPQFSREAVAAAVLNAAHSRREQALKFRVPPLFFQYLDVEEDDLDVEVLREIDSKSSSMMQRSSFALRVGYSKRELNACALCAGGILSLPNELLIAIATAGQGGSVTVQQLRPEWSLSQVCRRFRDIIVGAPVLWTLIELDLHSDMLADIANLYFTRSQACHLRTILRECKDTDDELIAERLSVIVPHIHRIRQLRIFLFANPQIALAPLRHVAAPNLERLEIRNTLEAFEMNPVEIFSLGAPMLTFICMKCITLTSLYRGRPPLPT